MSASTQRVFEIPSRISVFLLNVSCCSEPLITIHTPASATSVVAHSLPPQNRSACPPSRSILIRIPRNRPEVQFCAELGVACTLGDAKVGRWGHPQNFVGRSIEEEQKFWGWICRGGCGEAGSRGVGGCRDRRSSGGYEATIGRLGQREGGNGSEVGSGGIRFTTSITT